MIVITYLFSQAISNSGLIERIFQPALLRFVHTPFQCLIAIVILFYLTMYVIPQPLARLIIVAAMFEPVSYTHLWRSCGTPAGSEDPTGSSHTKCAG